MTGRTLESAKQPPVAPRWFAYGLVIGGSALLPWTVFLTVTLPRDYTSHHYRGAWTGFNAVLVALLITTGVGALRESRWLDMAAATTGMMIFVDAWFDVMGSGNAQDTQLALTLALLIEVPAGILCWFLALRASRRHHSAPD